MTRCASKFELISIAAITVPEDRARELQPDVVDQLAESMEREGQINPISVRVAGDGAYTLVTGLHRLRATEKNGRKSIQASIWSQDMPDQAVKAHELTENLWRAELTPAERQASTLELAALFREESESGTPGSTLGGRGNTGVASAIGKEIGVTKQSVNRTAREASKALGEPVSLANDSPSELKDKARKVRTVAAANGGGRTRTHITSSTKGKTFEMPSGEKKQPDFDTGAAVVKLNTKLVPTEIFRPRDEEDRARLQTHLPDLLSKLEHLSEVLRQQDDQAKADEEAAFNAPLPQITTPESEEIVDQAHADDQTTSTSEPEARISPRTGKPMRQWTRRTQVPTAAGVVT